MKRIVLFHLALCFIFSVGEQVTRAGSLRGTIRDAATLSALAGVDVTVHVVIPDSIPYPATTDENGEYAITGIVPNNEVYAVVTYKFGFLSTYTRIEDLGSQDLIYDILLDSLDSTPPGGGGGDSSGVAGSILTPIGGDSLAPVPDAILTFDGDDDIVAATDADGAYGLVIPVGSYVVSVAATGYDTLDLGMMYVDSTGARINAVLQSNVVSVGDEMPIPMDGILHPNYPNPFNPTTWISFSLPRTMSIRLRILDVLGREVGILVDGVRGPGDYRVHFDAAGLSDGVYFSRLEGDGFSAVRPMLFLK